MSDLLDELGENKQKEVSQKVQNLGGDLLDEMAFKSGDQKLISPQISNAKITEQNKAAYDELNKSLTGLEKFLVGVGRGMATVGRGLGLVDPEPQAAKEAFGQLTDDSTAAFAGNIIGEAAPFAVAPTLGGGAAARILGAAALGGAEGNILSRGQGGDAGEQVSATATGGAIGAGIEAISPLLGRLFAPLFAKLGRQPEGPLVTPQGTPTPELQQALDETGTTFDEALSTQFATLNQQGINPAQAARAARFESQGIPATQGDISQDMAQQAVEQRLVNTTSEASEPMRQMRLEQSEAFKGKVNELVDSLGVPSDVGDSIKESLTSRKKVLKSKKNALYEEVANASPDIANTPLFTDSIAEAIPDKTTTRRIGRLASGPVEAVNELLVEFGIDTDPEAVAKFVEKNGEEIMPLTLGNFEEFRQAINLIERSDQTGAVKVITGPIKNALDDEADIVDTAIRGVEGVDSGVLDKLTAARETVRTLKTEFSPQAITGRLIDKKKDGVTPVIEASKVANELLKPTAPIENLQRTISSLKKSGDAGKKAIGNMQAAVVMNALDAALKAPSRKTSGIETVGGEMFSKSLSKFGDDKLEVLFKDNPKKLNALRNLKQTALDMSPDNRAMPKGSAAVILDIVGKVGTMPGLAAMRDVAKFMVEAGADERAVRRAMNSNPEIKRKISEIEKNFPNIARSLGVSAITPSTQREENR